MALWALGYPEKGIADDDNALKEAEEVTLAHYCSR
jgi:hypothetical protein